MTKDRAGSSSAILCSEHGAPVELARGEPLICHQDGSFCRSERFTAETLSREQVMALLITARGLRVMRDSRSG